MERQDNQVEYKPHRHRLLYVLCIASLILACVSILLSSAALIDVGEVRFALGKGPPWTPAHQRIDAVFDVLDSLDSLIDDNRISLLTLGFADSYKGRVDLTSSSAQHIEGTFLVSDLQVSEHLTGVNVTGRIVNTSSITHETLTFRIVMHG
ncbi:MAG: hypothetical protein KAW61_03670, partial [candidate division Zixibacteria bacterium]|nr:hypothetical protein [candidate division Zixibacteria bacterium]